MNYDREFLTGTVGVLILGLLSERAMYGYEILQEAERRSAQQFQMKEGTLYPALHQMERSGLLKADWREVLKQHVTFEKCAIEALDAMSKSQVAAVTKSWAARMRAKMKSVVKFIVTAEERMSRAEERLGHIDADPKLIALQDLGDALVRRGEIARADLERLHNSTNR